MTEHDSDSPNSVLGQMERLAALGAPVAAQDMPAFNALMLAGLLPDLDPLAIVARRSVLTDTDSGSVEIYVTVEHLTPLGINAIKGFEAAVVRGGLTISCDSFQPFEIRGHRVDCQSTELQISATPDDIQVSTTVNVPLSPEMVEATTAAWADWGYKFVYVVNDVGGMWGIEDLTGSPSLTDRLANASPQS